MNAPHPPPLWVLLIAAIIMLLLLLIEMLIPVFDWIDRLGGVQCQVGGYADAAEGVALAWISQTILCIGAAKHPKFLCCEALLNRAERPDADKV
jgi:hypothetical protein